MKSYEENYEQGPFGVFTDGEVLKDEGEPKYDFFGEKISSPFGIAAGPLVNSKFIKAAFEKSFDICVYKTVRSAPYPCHPYPNVVSVKVDGNLTPQIADEGVVMQPGFPEPITITNSFGVPSRDPEFWKADCDRAISYASEGQLVVLSFMGTVRANQTKEEFIEDHAKVARQAKSTKAKIFEMNLSCPNVGNEGLICFDLDMTEAICKRVREELGDSPLILKVGYYKDDNDLERLAEIASKYAEGVAVINTIQTKIFDEKGGQALPGGPARLRSGVAGAGIKWAGLEMTEKLAKLRRETKSNFQIIGVGGVMTADDFFEYREAGADIVMSVTGAMWNPYLAKEIKSRL
jgi:dihydroorotate dehydrogenase (NAD+) catalytic subunit